MKIFLYAYDKINLGDDLFIRSITERYPNTRFYMFSSPQNKAVFSSLKNLKIINENSCLSRLLKRIRSSFAARYKHALQKRCDAVVYIGGSIFIEYDSWRNILNWWEYTAKSFPLYVLGANFGPYKTEEYKNRLGDILCNTRDICFRDKYSFGLFSDCGKARYAPDILFSTDFPECAPNQKQIFVSVIDCSKRTDGLFPLSEFDTDYKARLVSVLSEFLSEGYELILSSFCSHEGDENAVNDLTEALKPVHHGKLSVLNYNGTNHELILKAIKKSRLIIATRFHAAILGLASGRAVFPIVYSDKTVNALHDIGFSGNIADLRLPETVTFSAAKENMLTPLPNIKPLKAASALHFAELDKLIGGYHDL